MGVDAFSAFERQGWEKLAQTYHSYYATLTSQSIDVLLVALDLQPGDRLLDVATGPGYLAASATARGANIVGIDFAVAMVDLARRLYPALEFRVENAEALPFADQSGRQQFRLASFPAPRKSAFGGVSRTASRRKNSFYRLGQPG